jgi:hypothetical protein
VGNKERIKDIVVVGGGGDFTGFKKQFIATSFWFYFGPIVFVVAKCFCKKMNFFLQINFLMFLYCLNMLMSKTIFLFKKIISMHFQAKSILKTNHYHNAKQALHSLLIDTLIQSPAGQQLQANAF